MYRCRWQIITLIILVASTSQINSAFAQEKDRNLFAKVITSESNDDNANRDKLSEREQLLINHIERLEKRLAELEAVVYNNNTQASAITSNTRTPLASISEQASRSDNSLKEIELTALDRDVLDFFRDTTINLTIDGYFGYNFNRPFNRVNLLRAYDVTSNSLTINQAALIVERAHNLAENRRLGLRLDLLYGQATETVAGSANNELRPQVYRNLFQAYGTYVAPIGSGLTVDFGKFSSALGLEGNYNKDQINYSRAFLFNFLPYYHLGFRSTYNINNKLAVTHWLVNGISQSEDFNGFKSQAILINLKPSARISANFNYYTGIENRDSLPNFNHGFPEQPSQPGLPTVPIKPVPRGRTHIIDSYITINATDKLTLAGEFDYVINRVQTFSAPSRVMAGAIYARYQLTPKFALAGRAEYLSDRGGLFSGLTQALKEMTFTTEYKLADGFLMRGEYRRDFSNQPFFLTNQPGTLKKEQNTVSLGLIWWFGRKQGSW